ncbi:MAG: ribonuclease HII [Helicobacteraceae bacterium]|jgi:ribonuclease HII|nr:ribonuclease HII [Helicobacteraceae bacterium]
MIICGIDEAGRGTLAGDLAVAGVVLIRKIEGLKDSKKLSRERREKLFDIICANSIYHIALINAAAIDKTGLSRALASGLREIKNAVRADIYIYDGNCAFGVEAITTQIKADACVEEVSAASILAKVSKDRSLLLLAENYPQYGFEKHQGYGVKAHIEAIKKYGYTPFHRRSFVVKELL